MASDGTVNNLIESSGIGPAGAVIVPRLVTHNRAATVAIGYDFHSLASLLQMILISSS